MNQVLARRLVEGTKIYSALSKGFRRQTGGRPSPCRRDPYQGIQHDCRFPEIAELDINPLVISNNEVIALDARIVLDTEVVKKGEAESSH